MWFWFSIIALLCWSGSDLFSKIGCRDEHDKYSHLKMLTAVGCVMGLHAFYQIFINDITINAHVLASYFPVSILYIASMALGYLGLRYIELSISSPICNSSGALVAVLAFSTQGLGESNPSLAIVAVALVCIGIIGLGFTEASEDPNLRAARQSEGNRKYVKSTLAIAIPIIYCLLDALGTFADSKVLEILDENSANCAYELTFFLVGIIAFLYTACFKKQQYYFKAELPKYLGAVFETIGQFFYIFAMADSAHVAYAAPIISAYCIVSVVWARLFLKEKLSVKHYVCIAVVCIGIIILGILDL